MSHAEMPGSPPLARIRNMQSEDALKRAWQELQLSLSSVATSK